MNNATSSVGIYKVGDFEVLNFRLSKSLIQPKSFDFTTISPTYKKGYIFA